MVRTGERIRTVLISSHLLAEVQQTVDALLKRAKAANLGEIQSARLADVSVPDGFCIPFAAYADFMRANAAVLQALAKPEHRVHKMAFEMCQAV